MQRDPDFPEDSKLYDIREQLTALWQEPYRQQLAAKFGTMASTLHSVTYDLARRVGDSAQPAWLQAALRQPGDWQPACPLEVRRFGCVVALQLEACY